MYLESRVIGEVQIIKVLEERLDTWVADDFKNEMAKLINNGNKYFVLNLSEVDFVDSSGLGVLLHSLKNLERMGGIAICQVKTMVKNLFQLTRMDGVFPVFEREEEAVADFSKAPECRKNATLCYAHINFNFVKNLLEGDSYKFKRHKRSC